jgi:predicted phosphoribosyltransferase
MGAVATGNMQVTNSDLVQALGISQSILDAAVEKELQVLARRESYRQPRPSPKARGRTVILVDDGLATGSTMHAAIAALKQQQPARIVVAVPVAPLQTCEELKSEVDEVICTSTPDPFHAVGLWFENFTQLNDTDVRNILERAEQQFANHAGGP